MTFDDLSSGAKRILSEIRFRDKSSAEVAALLDKAQSLDIAELIIFLQQYLPAPGGGGPFVSVRKE